MEKKNILISVIGDRDPIHFSLFQQFKQAVEAGNNNEADDLINNNAGPILETLDIFNTHLPWKDNPIHGLFLIYTDDSSAKSINERKEWLDKYCQAAGLEIVTYDLKTKKPHRYEAVLPLMIEATNVVKCTWPNSNYFVLTSPGTPQMTTSWIVLGNERCIQGHYLQKTPGIEAVNLEEIKLSPYFELEKINQVIRIFTDQLAFKTASEMFSKISEDTFFSNKKQLYRAVACLCDIYDCWFSSRFQEAIELLENEKSSLDEYILQNTKINSTQILEALQKLNKNDIIENAKHLLTIAHYKQIQRDYKSCVTTSFMAYEYIINQTLKQKYNFNDFDLGDMAQKENRLRGVGFSYTIKQRGKSITKQIDGANPKHSGMVKVNTSLATDLRIHRNDIIHNKNEIFMNNLDENDLQNITKRQLKNAKRIVKDFLELDNDYLDTFPFRYNLLRKYGDNIRRFK